MIKCGIRKSYLLTILLFLGPYLWIIEHIISKGTIKPGAIIAVTLIFTLPIYGALFQVKTIEIKNGLITVFYPFRLWTKKYKLNDIEAWKYRKMTKTIRFDVYFRSRYIILKFKRCGLISFCFSLGLTNFDELLTYLNERHKDTRTNKINIF